MVMASIISFRAKRRLISVIAIVSKVWYSVCLAGSKENDVHNAARRGSWNIIGDVTPPGAMNESKVTITP